MTQRSFEPETSRALERDLCARFPRAWPLLVFFALLAGPLGSPGCKAEPPPSVPGVYWAHSPPQCKMNETREFYCDNLVARHSAYPAPPPYQDCPANNENHTGDFEPVPPVSVFDASYTLHMRQRTPPGSVCCYSWCSRFTVPKPNPYGASESCRKVSAFREAYCIYEPEGGTSRSAPAPYNKCPAAIVPPQKAVFSVPDAAVFDDRLTADRRGEGARECCYSWCSQAPPTSGLERSR